MKRIVRIAALAAAALLSTAADKPAGNWIATVTVEDNGSHVLGNPSAALKLTEFVSYTCPHCAHFHKDADAPLKLAYVQPGKASVHIHHVIRDPVDLTAAMLANCGDSSRFFSRHNAFMQAQDTWLTKLSAANAAQKQRWTSGPMKARLQAISSDFGFYRMMENRGFTRTAVDRCLGDEAMAQKLMRQTQEAAAMGVQGTPSFALNGNLLQDTHDWQSLEARIKSEL